MSSRETAECCGVFYQRADYLGVGKRLLIDFIDAFVTPGLGLAALALLWFWYFVPMFGTTFFFPEVRPES